jgi:hypothetical protein
MPITVGITIPISITVHIFCTDPSCEDLAYSYILDQTDSTFDLASESSYIFESDGSEFEEYFSDVDLDVLLPLLLEALSGSEKIDMNAYNDLLETSFMSDPISTTADEVDIGALNDRYVELYNKYYGE